MLIRVHAFGAQGKQKNVCFRAVDVLAAREIKQYHEAFLDFSRKLFHFVIKSRLKFVIMNII